MSKITDHQALELVEEWLREHHPDTDILITVREALAPAEPKVAEKPQGLTTASLTGHDETS